MSDCLFCRPREKRLENELVFARYDDFPANGHTLNLNRNRIHP